MQGLDNPSVDVSAAEDAFDHLHVLLRLVIVRTGWHGSGRGPQSDMEWTNVFTIRDGRFINVQYFWDHAEALEAAGLSE